MENFHPISVKVPMSDNATIWCISHSSKSCVVCKLVEGLLCPITYVINEDINQDWTHY